MKKLKASDVIDIDEDFIAKIVKELNKTEEPDIERYYTVSQVAGKVKKNEATIRQHIKNYEYNNGKRWQLKAVKIGKNWLIPHESLETYLQINSQDNDE